MEDLIESVIQGFPIGCVFALVAVGFVLTYKVSGVFNLAFGAQAFASAAVYFELRVNRAWPIPPAVGVAVLVVAPVLGVALYWLLFRSLRGAPPVARLAVSIGLLLAIPAITKLVLDFGSSPQFGVEGIVADGRSVYRFGSYAVTRNELATIAVTLVMVVGLTVLFRYTAIGLRMRAVVESPRMTELAGVSSDRVSSVGWGLSSLFAGLAGVLLAPLFPQLSEGNFFLLIVVAIAAAAFAGLESLPLALVGGIALGVGAQILARFLPTGSILAQGLRPSLPFIVLFLVLVLKPSLQRKREAADPLAGADPPPPALASDERGPALTYLTYGLGALAGAIALWYFAFQANSFWLLLASQTVVFSIIFCSIVVFTGIAGEISLAQGAFAAIGAFTCGQLATNLDMPVLVTAVLGAALAAVVGAALALPVMRLGGIYLALATLAFALFFQSVVVRFAWVSGGQLPIEVPRPVIGPFDLESDRGFFFFSVLMLALVGFAVIRVRGGTVGKNLMALKGSERAAASIGISPARMRVTAFALSASIAGFGGALLSMLEGRANYEANFTVEFGLFWIVLVVVLGARTVEGAVNAALGLKFFPELLKILSLAPAWQFIFFGLGTVTFARHPEGVIEFQKRKSLNAVQRRLDRRREKHPSDESPSAGSVVPAPPPRPAAPVAASDGAD